MFVRRAYEGGVGEEGSIYYCGSLYNSLRVKYSWMPSMESSDILIRTSQQKFLEFARTSFYSLCPSNVLVKKCG